MFIFLSISLLIILAAVVAGGTFSIFTSTTNTAFAQTTTETTTTTTTTTSVTGTETPVVTDDGPQMDTSIAGDRISYTDASAGSADVKYYDISSGTTHTAGGGPGDQQLGDISESYIAYTNYSTGAGDIWIYEISTEELTLITPSNPEFDQSYPALSDQIVAWEGTTEFDRSIWIYDITTGQSKSITGEGDQNTPEVSGDRVVYVDNNDGDLIKVYDASSDTTDTISAGASGFPDIDGNSISYNDYFSSPDAEVAVYDMDTGETHLLQMQGHQLNPHISGEWVSFEHLDPETGSHVVLWHWTAGNNPETDTFLIGPTTSQQTLSDIDGNRVIYTDNRNSNLDIYMYEFSEEESPPPPPPPTTTWTIEGFYPPVDMTDEEGNPIVNTIRSGQAVALKFEVFDENGQELTDTEIVDTFTQENISCDTLQGEDTDSIEEPLTDVGNTQLTYDQDSGQFIKHWKTPSRQPNTCWEVELTTTDGSSISAYFRLR